jgi:AraC-like DNA-binding protein
MIYEVHVPKGVLAKYIDNIVFFEGYTAQHKADKLLPDGGIYMIINMLEKPEKLYKDEHLKKFEEFTGCFISGQHKNFIFIEAEHSSNMAIKFKLGGAAPFFNFPISHLNNKVQQLEPILGKEIENVRKEIINEKDISKKFELIENYFLKTIRKEYEKNLAFMEVLEFLATSPHLANISQLSDKMNVSQKHLITLFNKQVGLTPKALARIFRFQKVILQLEEKEKTDWLQIAIDCGYYDQAHFVKDFYSFSGIRPTGYAEQKGEYLNYIPVK